MRRTYVAHCSETLIVLGRLTPHALGRAVAARRARLGRCAVRWRALLSARCRARACACLRALALRREVETDQVLELVQEDRQHDRLRRLRQLVHDAIADVAQLLLQAFVGL